MAITVFLVVEEAMILEVVTEMLRRLMPNVHVETASDEKEALQKINQHTPSHLITDILMPNLGSFELLKIISEIRR